MFHKFNKKLNLNFKSFGLFTTFVNHLLTQGKNILQGYEWRGVLGLISLAILLNEKLLVIDFGGLTF